MALAIVAIILALALLAFVLIGFASRECNSDKDCREGQYCAVGHECKVPAGSSSTKSPNYIWPALIIGIAIIIAAYIFRKGDYKKYIE